MQPQGYYQRNVMDPSVDAVFPTGGVAQITLGAAIAATLGDLIGWDGTQWAKADANSNPPVPAQFVAMTSQGTAGGVLQVCQSGVLYKVSAPYVAGTRYFLSGLGAPTATLPVAAAALTLLQPVGLALSTTRLLFDFAHTTPYLLRFQATYDPASLAAVTARSDTVAVTGLLTTDVIRGMPEVVITGTGWNTGLFVAGLDVSATDTLRIRLVNPTAGALDGASVTIEAIAERW